MFRRFFLGLTTFVILTILLAACGNTENSTVANGNLSPTFPPAATTVPGDVVKVTPPPPAKAGSGGAMAMPNVPDKLKVAAGETLLTKATGKGVQIYTCAAVANDTTKFQWTLKAPEADLFNDKGDKIGKHYAGPTWEANDGSKVVGEAKERVDNAGSIQLLLLKAKSNAGTGLFSKVTSIQRLDTTGGVAPTTGCDVAHKDAETRVNYTANYYFYNSK